MNIIFAIHLLGPRQGNADYRLVGHEGTKGLNLALRLQVGHGVIDLL